MDKSNQTAKLRGDEVIKSLVRITPEHIKGAHDGDFCIIDDKAYIVYMANDERPSESAFWPIVYCNLTVVDINSQKVLSTKTFAASEKQYNNKKLAAGACFVPRIIQKDSNTLRCFFTSEEPEHRQSQVCFVDYDLGKGEFDNNLYEAKIETSQGIFPMQPQHFYNHAVSKGFEGQEETYGLYMIDGIKSFDKFPDQHFAVVNNFISGHNALAKLNEDMDRFTIIGDYFQPNSAKLTESAINMLPDGSWCAISRQENNDNNFLFSTSNDGRNWTQNQTWDFIINGEASKPTFNKFGDTYFLGWQEKNPTGAYRTTFNIDTSTDGQNWQRQYILESDKSFQYPTFKFYNNSVYLTVTQGLHAEDRKEFVMFGKLF